METFSLISIISIALFGSFGHCIGMCGGIVVAYSSSKIKDEYTKLRQIIAHLMYGFGRVTSYSILGAIFGFLGSVIAFTAITKGILFFITGILLVLIGFSLLGKLKFLTKVEHSFSKSKAYQKIFRQVVSSDSFFSFYFVGILNGFLPCGFVYVFAITAASTASIIQGALVMFIFGLCTIPALFVLGFFIGVFKQSKLRDVFMKLASILVIVFGLFTMYKGFVFITSQNNMMVEHNHNVNNY
ncbi:sulfite exporter TauE/SafE family protein [Aliarcobacter lanthieri]|uniref:sulfite exporter TauE/SafE family protein n=1 Tax=Aliarcobacter lanthieri TaxID=1355374 RepID=UPI003AAC97DB